MSFGRAICLAGVIFIVANQPHTPTQLFFLGLLAFILWNPDQEDDARR